MRHAIAFVLLVGCFAPSARALPAPQAATEPGKPAVRACSLLTKELVLQVTPMDKSIALLVPPSEDSLGARGSACEYGGIHLQIDPFSPARLDDLSKERGTAWTPVPEVGDAAYFFDNRGEYAELYVRVGARVFTIQMSVPGGRTIESVKPNAITLAKALEPKLR